MKNEKNSRAKLVFRRLTLAFAFLAFISVGNVQSQSLVTEAEAMPILTTEIEDLETILVTLTPGSSNYYQVNLKLALYAHVYESLSSTDIELNHVIRERGQDVTHYRAQYNPLATSGDVAVIESQLRNLLAN